MHYLGRILTRITILFLLMVTIDMLLGSFLKKVYFSIHTGLYGNLTYIIEESKEDIIILGSSRAFHHYNSEIIERRTGLSTQNAGYSGQSTVFYNAIFKSILRRHVPKIVVLDMIPYSVGNYSDSFEKLTCLLPYYGEHEETTDIIYRISPLERYKVISSLYRYNSTPYYLLKEKIYPTKGIKKGFKPIIGLIDSTKFHKPGKIEEFELSDYQVKSLNEILLIAKERNLIVVLTISPTLYKTDIYKNLRQYLSAYADNQDVFLFDYSLTEEFKKAGFFYDPIHMNKQGADYFSELISDDLIGILKNKESISDSLWRKKTGH